MRNEIKTNLLAALKKLGSSSAIPEDAFISVKDSEEKCFAFNNTSIPVAQATEDNIIIVDFDGKVLQGDANGIDSYFTVHKAIYEKNGEIATIINPRSRWNSIWSELGISLSPSSFFYAKHFCGEILCTGSVTLEPGEDLYEALGQSIISRLHNKGIQARGAIIVRNDSAMVWGTNPEATANRAIVLDEICFRALQTTAISQGSNTYVAWEVSEQLLEKE